MASDLVFLTGATGFVGGHVLRELLAAGYQVRALVRGDAIQSRGIQAPPVRGHLGLADPHGAGCEFVTGDLRQAGQLVPALRGCRFVVHCAALYSFAPRDRAALRETNVAGTTGLLEAARLAGVERAVVTSSSATVGPARNGSPATEEQWALDGRDSAYHRSKIDQERAALAARVPAVLLLPTTPVGPGDWKPTPTGKMVLDFARGRMIAAPPPGGMNLVAVEDVARAHVAALDRGRTRERYLVGGANLSLDEIWSLLASVTGRPKPRWRIPYGLALAAGYADELRCRLVPGASPAVPLEGVRLAREQMFVDCSKAAAELGHRPSPVRDALERAVAWYRDNGYAA